MYSSTRSTPEGPRSCSLYPIWNFRLATTRCRAETRAGGPPAVGASPDLSDTKLFFGVIWGSDAERGNWPWPAGPCEASDALSPSPRSASAPVDGNRSGSVSARSSRGVGARSGRHQLLRTLHVHALAFFFAQEHLAAAGAAAERT